MNDLVAQLLQQQNECTLCWVRSDNRPAATIVSFIWADNALWMTALADSARVRALQQRPHATIVITGKGTSLGGSRCVSMQGRCVVRPEQAVRDWFFPVFADAVLPDNPKGSQLMADMMRGQENLVLQFLPERCLPYDSHDLMEAARRL